MSSAGGSPRSNSRGCGIDEHAARVSAERSRTSDRVATAHRSLDHGNPNIENIKKDFNRFGFSLNMAASDPANYARLAELKLPNKWRNIVAHHGTVPPGGLPFLPAIQAWRNSCDGLATSLDGIMYNRLRNLLRRQPWIP